MLLRSVLPHVLAVALILMSLPAAADVRLPALFSDHMVLQRGRPIPVWGWAAPGATISVSLDGAQGQISSGQASARPDSTWRVDLAPQPAGGPYRLVVQGDGRVVVHGVLVGEVWIGSGQSNMQWSVSGSNDAEVETAAADWARIRLFQVPLVTSAEPRDDVDAAWEICSPETIGRFSGVLYFFGRRLHQELDVPVGLIHSSWGGTRIEPWTDLASVRALAPSLPDSARDQLEVWLARADSSAQDVDSEVAERWEASVEELKRAEADSLDVPLATADLDDGDWPTMEVPVQWEDSGLEGFDGMVWFRRTVEVPESWTGRDLSLHLAKVDDVDITWFDGLRVGSSGDYARSMWAWQAPRVYRIPARLVAAGRAVVAVRVIDQGGGGGLRGAPEDLYLTPAGGDGSERVSLVGAWRYQPVFQLAPRPPENPQIPAVLYHAMIHPLIPYAFRGAIWYQGESNLGDGAVYRAKMETLVDSWRRAWDQGAFPFLFAQLAPFRYGIWDADPRLLPALWEAQSDVLLTVRNTGMAVITDVSDLDDIHPTDKQTVGSRLAGWALARTYDRDLPYSGPAYLGMEIEGSSVRLRFDHAAGLRSADDEPLSWFEIAGADSQFVEAQASVEASAVVVSSPEVEDPRYARFGWHEEAEPNLVNGAGLPASPFRTHRW